MVCSDLSLAEQPLDRNSCMRALETTAEARCCDLESMFLKRPHVSGQGVLYCTYINKCKEALFSILAGAGVVRGHASEASYHTW